MADDNQVILDRAADSCRALDDIRYKLYTIQKQLAQARTQSGAQQQDMLGKANKEKAMTALLHEAYTLQFQIATLLASTEEPIPERQRRRPKNAQTLAEATTTTMTTAATETESVTATETVTESVTATATETVTITVEGAATFTGGEPPEVAIPSVTTELQQPLSVGQDIFDTTMASQMEADFVLLDDDL